MKKILLFASVVSFLVVLSGCAGQTTDPRQGGLFNYNPEAYQQRLQTRQETLNSVAAANEAGEQDVKAQEERKRSQLREKAELEQMLCEILNETTALEATVRTKQAERTAVTNEQARIIAEIEKIKSSLHVTDNIEDPEEKRLELERLRQRRDELEREAAQLISL